MDPLPEWFILWKLLLESYTLGTIFLPPSILAHLRSPDGEAEEPPTPPPLSANSSSHWTFLCDPKAPDEV